MTKFNVNQMMYEAVIAKTCKDFLEQPQESLDRWLEKDRKRPQEQEAILVKVKQHLKKPGGKYRGLLERLSKEVSPERWRTLAMLLVYHIGNRGSQTARNQELRYGIHIPWTVIFELGGKMRASHVQGLAEQGVALGIHCYQLFCPNQRALEGLSGLFSTRKDCLFLVYLSPELVTEALIEEWQDQQHILPFVRLGELATGPALARLRAKGFLCSGYWAYDSGQTEAIRQGRYLKLGEKDGVALTAFWPKRDVSASLQGQVYQSVRYWRDAQGYASFPMDVVGDCLEVDRLLSKEATLLYFDSKGQRILVERGYEVGEENCFTSPFLKILEG